VPSAVTSSREVLDMFRVFDPELVGLLDLSCLSKQLHVGSLIQSPKQAFLTAEAVDSRLVDSLKCARENGGYGEDILGTGGTE